MSQKFRPVFLKLRFIAESPPPSNVFRQVALIAAWAGTEYSWSRLASHLEKDRKSILFRPFRKSHSSEGKSGLTFFRGYRNFEMWHAKRRGDSDFEWHLG
jgi:hypothetical protein